MSILDKSKGTRANCIGVIFERVGNSLRIVNSYYLNIYSNFIIFYGMNIYKFSFYSIFMAEICSLLELILFSLCSLHYTRLYVY